MNCKNTKCGRHYSPSRSAALGTEPGYCQPSCADQASKDHAEQFAAWFENRPRTRSKENAK